jgi:DNA polymerase III epsilon subunit-like protein
MNLRPEELAKGICAAKPIYLDTETTGLTDDDEICEISIMDYDGSVLLNTLVQPIMPIPAAASAIHGITDEMVDTAPPFPEILPQVLKILKDRILVVYNLEYDLRMLHQSGEAHDFVFNLDPSWYRYHCKMACCAMEIYAEFWGEWSSFHGNYKWQRLGDAMRQQGIKFEGTMHRALADCQVTRLLMLKMAGIKEGDPE